MIKSKLIVIALCIALGACQKKSEEAAPAAKAQDQPAPAPTTEPTAEQLDLARKQAALDYATMEDAYLNDPKGQWAKDATASSTFGDSQASGASDSNKPINLIGKPDGNHWTNDHQDMGFDSFEATFEKPVYATEVRAVFREGAAAVSKVELRDTEGKFTTAWAGINEEKREERGPRSWFVRKFDKTANAIQGVKITIANSVEGGYKVVDAVQLVGE